MRRFLTLFLIINALAFSSCGSLPTVNGFDNAELTSGTYEAAYFTDVLTDYIYKARISVYGNELGGIVIIKKINDNTHRVAFTTEFGNKLFDFEISQTDFTVKYILEDLDRKIIVNTLKQDFMLLLKKHHTIDAQYSNGKFTVYKSESNNRFNYLFVDEHNSLVKLVHATKAKEKVIFTYLPASPTLAHNIVIDHKTIKLKIELNYINQ